MCFPGDYVIIRTNQDAVPAHKTAGLRWGGSHQISPDRRAKLTVSLEEMPEEEESITVTSHTKDGCIYDTGKFESNNLICGYTGGHPYNGIVFFELPTNLIATANINLTVAQNYGPLTNANIDVWGLGYMTDPNMDHAWQLMADTDTRSLVNTNVTFTKIADDFIAIGETTPSGSVDKLGTQDSTNLVEFLNSLFDKGAVPGDYAVIRLNPDAWFTAGQNVRWADEKDSGTRATMTMTLTEEPAIPPVVDDISIYSHENDGSIYGETPGSFTAQELICGTAGSPNTRPWNGVSFFQLPSNRVTSANLIFKVYSASSSWSSTGAGIDVWGLGYTSSPVLDASWLLMDDTDTRTLLNGSAPTKIADDLLVAGVTPATDSIWSLNDTQSTNLVNFVNGLFDKGAQPGDYAVIRINPDVAILTGGLSIWFGSSTTADADQRNALTYTLSDAYPTDGMFQHISQATDGGVYGFGADSGWDLDSSTGGSDPIFDISGIAFFALPEQPMTSASISLVAESFRNALVDANLDMWGLGYMSALALDQDWLCISNNETRTFLNGRSPVKLMDDFVTSGEIVASGYTYTSTEAQSTAITDYLNGLYSKGAKPGDFAVIRINMDATQEGLDTGIRWGGSHRTDPDHRASMSGLLNDSVNYLANESFESGEGAFADDWTVVENGHDGGRISSSTRNGTQAYQMSADGTNGTYESIYIAQDVSSPDFAGKRVTLSGYASHTSANPMVSGSGQRVYFRLFWLGGSQDGEMVDSSSYNNLLPTDVTDEYKPIYVSAIVPADITGIKVVIVFDTGTTADPSITTGSGVVDDLRLTIFQSLPSSGTILMLR